MHQGMRTGAAACHLFLVLIAGCDDLDEVATSMADDDESLQAGVELDDSDVASAEHGDTLALSQEFSWYQGNPSTPMGPVDKRVCFLTFVRGKFEGGGEMVRVYSSNGSWYLGGTSQQSGVAAKARCVSVSTNADYTTEYSWGQGQLPVKMADAYTYSCFLTRMKGKFMGGGEQVEIIRDISQTGRWTLGGKSSQSSVAAGARCIRGDSTKPKAWSQGYEAAYLATASDVQGCFLTRVTGKFRGSGEYVHAFITGGYWYLGGQSFQQSVGATARCLM